MARPRLHALVTLAALGWRWHHLSWSQRLAFAAGGVLVDADHLVDLLLYRRAGRRLWRVLPLHGWEHVVVLVTIGGAGPGRGLARLAGLGLLLHLALDQLTNRPDHPAFFSLLYRLRHGFAAERLSMGRGDGQWVHQPWWRWL